MGIGAWAEAKHPRDAKGRFTSSVEASKGNLGKWANRHNTRDEKGRFVPKKDDSHTLEKLGVSRDENLSRHTQDNIEAGIKKAGFAALLKSTPLDQGFGEHETTLVAANGVSHDLANGLYAWRTGQHAISLLDPKGFQERFDKKESFLQKRNELRAEKGKKPREKQLGPSIHSVSSLGKNPDDMQQRTAVHELSHHLHLANLGNSSALSKKIDKEIKQAYEARKGGGWTVSKYAKANHKEWFAETHSAYVFHPKELKANDPAAYKLMQTVRKARGMLT